MGEGLLGGGQHSGKVEVGCGGGGRQSGTHPGHWNEEITFLFQKINCGPKEVELEVAVRLGGECPKCSMLQLIAA